MTTKVIFRKWPNGNIIALFPELPGTNSPFTCLSYEHYGQHGAASTDLPNTVLAKPREYEELRRELVSIGYDDLKVCTRFTRKDYDTRKKAITQ
jgi:hypothetical protein